MASGMVKRPRINNFLGLGLFLALISLGVFAIFLIRSLNIEKKAHNVNFDASDKPLTAQDQGTPNTDQWEKYTNNEFGFSLLYPGLLVRRETNNSSDYLSFVRFQENSFSAGTTQKGVAIGVSDVGLGVESVRIKKTILDEGGELISEKEIKFASEEAVRLDFEPKDTKIFERRTVVIVVKNGKTFSISSVPEQIDKILEGFTFSD